MPAPSPIPFNRPLFLEAGITNVRAAYENGRVAGDGDFSRRCQGALERSLGGGKVLLTTSCTDALELSALLLNIAPGDEVVVPAFTFVSTANAYMLRGARPVFVDIRPDTYNLDERALDAVLTPRTKAIVAVHYGGVACEMDPIMARAARHSLPVIEDNAHGLFGAYRGKPLGAWGTLAALSFHETKNISCGEGGALVLNDSRWNERANVLRDKGTDRQRFNRGETESYTWQDLGSSFLPAEILAAILWAQLEMREQIQNRRREIHQRYLTGLGDWGRARGVQLPLIPDHCQSSYHLFALLLPTPEARSALIRHLQERKIQAVSHYQALNLTPMGRSLGGRPGQCPVAESVALRLLRLPFYYGLSPADQDRVIAAVNSFPG
jgi:dTDP-4-amino-4,6-dideoxygalactose transaminase